MDVLLNSGADGLMLGLIYGLAAMGLTLIWGVMRVVNLAHGAAIVAGMFGVFLLSTSLSLNPYLSLVAVAVAGLALGMVVYFVALHRVIDAPELMTLLSTYAVSLIAIGGGTLVFSTTPRSLSVALGLVAIGPVQILGSRLVSAVLSLAAAALLYLFLYRTRLGTYIRAVANNRAAAALVGIDTTRVLALSFGLGIMMAAFAGGLIGTLFPFTILSGGSHELRSFLIVVLGGLGNPTGALVGGLVLGLVEGLATPFIQVSWVPVLEFTLLVAILLLRPSGLLGKRS
ncbi:MAG: branched-chain amino acid ABC transporter permease [Chloroflexi bacterium]|nr:branched-chain amino acid ABC transporter permease [Chloroflexota bacterium]